MAAGWEGKSKLEWGWYFVARDMMILTKKRAIMKETGTIFSRGFCFHFLTILETTVIVRCIYPASHFKRNTVTCWCSGYCMGIVRCDDKSDSEPWGLGVMDVKNRKKDKCSAMTCTRNGHDILSSKVTWRVKVSIVPFHFTLVVVCHCNHHHFEFTLAWAIMVSHCLMSCMQECGSCHSRPVPLFSASIYVPIGHPFSPFSGRLPITQRQKQPLSGI